MHIQLWMLNVLLHMKTSYMHNTALACVFKVNQTFHCTYKLKKAVIIKPCLKYRGVHAQS